MLRGKGILYLAVIVLINVQSNSEKGIAFSYRIYYNELQDIDARKDKRLDVVLHDCIVRIRDRIWENTGCGRIVCAGGIFL